MGHFAVLHMQIHSFLCTRTMAYIHGLFCDVKYVMKSVLQLGRVGAKMLDIIQFQYILWRTSHKKVKIIGINKKYFINSISFIILVLKI